MADVLADNFSSIDIEETCTCYSRRVEGKVTQVRSSCGFDTLLMLAVTSCAQLFLVVSINSVNLQERSFSVGESIGKVCGQC